MNAKNDRRLRPEARSVWLNTLSLDQQRAFEVIIDLLSAAIKDLPDAKEWQDDPFFDRGLDEHLTSRVLLLGGGRGSGKTTIASTLQKALSSGGGVYQPGLDDDEPSESTLSQAGKDARDNRKRVRADIRDLHSRVVVLEPLSVEDAPTETNVLAALLARIEQLLFPKLTHEDVSTTSSDIRQHDAVLELLRLQTDVAIAWNGNLPERRGELDPDNYAMEELRVERVRLQLRDRFATVLRRTLRDSLNHKENSALFLLIVDDADVNPVELMDLLERLRMVGVVEFVVLLVGDVETIESAFRLHFADRFRLSQRSIGPEQVGMSIEEMSSLTNTLARSALRRHIPYHQRVQIQPLLAREAVAIKPLRQKGDALGDKLDAVSVWCPAPPCAEAVALMTREEWDELSRLKEPARHEMSKRLATLEVKCERSSVPKAMTLGRFVYPIKVGAATFEDQSWYVGSRVLSDSPRVAVDLWNTVLDATESVGRQTAPRDPWGGEGSLREAGIPDRCMLDPRLHVLFRRLASERLEAKTDWERNDDIGSPINAALREAIIREGNLDALKLHLAHALPQGDSELVTAIERDESGQTLYWTGHHGLEFTVLGSQASRREIGPVALVADLWALENRSAAKGSIVYSSRGRLQWVCQGGVPWHVPLYRTIRQVEQFGYVWNNFLDHYKEPDRTTLAKAWIIIHTETLLGYEPDEFAGESNELESREERAAALLVELRGYAETGDDWERTVAKDWLADDQRDLEPPEEHQNAEAHDDASKTDRFDEPRPRWLVGAVGSLERDFGVTFGPS